MSETRTDSQSTRNYCLPAPNALYRHCSLCSLSPDLPANVRPDLVWSLAWCRCGRLSSVAHTSSNLYVFRRVFNVSINHQQLRRVDCMVKYIPRGWGKKGNKCNKKVLDLVAAGGKPKKKKIAKTTAWQTVLHWVPRSKSGSPDSLL